MVKYEDITSRISLIVGKRKLNEIHTHGSSSRYAPIGVTKSKSYEQLRMDISLCSYVIAPDAIAHCAFKLTHDIATTPNSPPINAFYDENKQFWGGGRGSE